jgi:hypothetical protein
MPEQCLNVPAATQHAKNERGFVLDTVDDDVLASQESFAGQGANPRHGLGLYSDG